MAEQLLRWWLLFRCESLPPSTVELVALDRHRCWQEALYTVQTASNPWDPNLAQELITLFAGRRDWELCLKLLADAPMGVPSSSYDPPTSLMKGSTSLFDDIAEVRDLKRRRHTGLPSAVQMAFRANRRDTRLALAIAERADKVFNSQRTSSVTGRIVHPNVVDETLRVSASCTANSAAWQTALRMIHSRCDACISPAVAEGSTSFAVATRSTAISSCVPPSVLNVAINICLHHAVHGAAVKYSALLCENFGPKVLSSRAVRGLARIALQEDGERPEQSKEGALLAVLAHTVEKMSNSDREQLAQKCDSGGDWVLALKFGGADYAVKSSSRVSNDFLQGSLLQAVSSRRHDVAAKIVEAAGDKADVFGVPALDALATTQLTQGNWLGALKTFSRLQTLAVLHAQGTTTPNTQELSLLESSLLDTVRDVETWKEALSLFL